MAVIRKLTFKSAMKTASEIINPLSKKKPPKALKFQFNELEAFFVKYPPLSRKVASSHASMRIDTYNKAGSNFQLYLNPETGHINGHVICKEKTKYLSEKQSVKIFAAVVAKMQEQVKNHKAKISSAAKIENQVTAKHFAIIRSRMASEKVSEEIARKVNEWVEYFGINFESKKK